MARKKQVKCEWCAEIKERIKEDFSYFKCPFCVGFPKVNGVEFQSTIYYNFTCKKHEKETHVTAHLKAFRGIHSAVETFPILVHYLPSFACLLTHQAVPVPGGA